MLSHVSLGVTSLADAARFYDAALACLGYVRLWTGPKGLGYGEPGGGEKLNIFETEKTAAMGGDFHLAFAAPDRQSVDRFHHAGLANGGLDAGGPGPRPQYGPTYYAAFVLDPMGHKLEAMHQ